jgi:glycosyltransferase involved in cell wall biosynthesis
MIRTNSIISDSRVFKEAKSLSSSGRFNVTVLAWDREAKNQTSEKIGRATINRMRFKASYSNLSLLAYLPVFWLWVLRQLFARHPDIVHAFDVDTVIPAYIYRNLTGRSKIVFDVCDRFSDSSLFSRPIVRPFRAFLAFLEDLFACKAEALIVVSQQQLRAFKRARYRNAQVIMNCPNENLLQKGARNKETNPFRIVHAGTIRGDYGIVQLVNALENISDVEMIVAGRVQNRRLVEYISKFPNVKFIGELPYEKALELEATADVIPILCDPRRPATPQALPNRLFESMMLGVPVIINDDLKSSVNIVSAVGCGVVVKYNANPVRKAILYLRENPSKRIEMGRKGQEACKSKYNWKKMEKLLLDTYERLTRARASQKMKTKSEERGFPLHKLLMRAQFLFKYEEVPIEGLEASGIISAVKIKLSSASRMLTRLLMSILLLFYVLLMRIRSRR